jgi:hypothetical protein
MPSWLSDLRVLRDLSGEKGFRRMQKGRRKVCANMKEEAFRRCQGSVGVIQVC